MDTSAFNILLSLSGLAAKPLKLQRYAVRAVAENQMIVNLLAALYQLKLIDEHPNTTNQTHYGPRIAKNIDQIAGGPCVFQRGGYPD